MRNKHKAASILFLSLSVLLIFVMIANAIIDYQHYLHHPEYSASFSVYFLFKGIAYVISCMGLLVLSFIFAKKGQSAPLGRK
ncbi:hypothetical protein DFR59_1058 [Falsibacillus pallidus]|uniref:Uncharacterized protein n=1 Tax=Falsibacillus pallidus TaxID=493781 RepID=A0A370GGC4_9BACI|nr:hypothetical protein DFR59_1058 [Falsibacillus pallidus]